MKKFIEWFISPSTKPDFEDYLLIDDLYNRMSELEEKVVKLQEENIENTNTLYELINSIEAVDRRIDIVVENPWKEQFE
jgi:flagellar biosynthesis/type III secretory pathway chaperone